MKIYSDQIVPVVLTAFSLINYALMYSLDLLFAQTMGTNGYDNYSVTLATLSILSTISTFGIEKYALKAIPTFVEAADWRALHGFVRFGSSAVMFVSVVLIAMFFLGRWSAVELFRSELHAAVIIGVLFLPLMSLFLFLMEVATAMKVPVWAMFIYRIILPATALAFGFILMGQRYDMTAVQAVISYAGGWVIALIAMIILLQQVRPVETKKLKASYDGMSWVRNSFPFTIYSLEMTLLASSGIILLELVGAEEVQVSIFAAASRTGSFIILIATSTNRFYLPELATCLERKDYEKLRHIENRRRYLIGTLCGLFLASMMIWGRTILGLYGEKFVAGYPALIVLATASSISTWFAVGPYYFKFVGQYSLVLGWTGFAAVSHLVLTILLAPQYGAFGTAIAYAIPIITLFLYFRIRAMRQLKKALKP